MRAKELANKVAIRGQRVFAVKTGIDYLCPLHGADSREARARQFMKLTQQIGCRSSPVPTICATLFSSRVQAAGVNPILVQEILGHATLDMTKRYTHLGLDTKHLALHRIVAGVDHGQEAT